MQKPDLVFLTRENEEQIKHLLPPPDFDEVEPKNECEPELQKSGMEIVSEKFFEGVAKKTEELMSKKIILAPSYEVFINGMKCEPVPYEMVNVELNPKDDANNRTSSNT